MLGASDIRAHPFGSGQDFIEALPDLDPGCVLLDLRMPQIDGFQQCALVMNGEVVTWRMAPASQKLHARVKASGEVTLIEISRDGRTWQTLQPHARVAARR